MDRTVFTAKPAAETEALNAEIIAKLSALPDQWAFAPHVVRQRRAEGLGPFPLAPKAPHAFEVTAEGATGTVPLRVIAPQTRPARGIYLHFHGGGWTLGSRDFQDPMLESIAEKTGLAAISVGYRLAPEHPYPAALHDIRTALDGYVLTAGRDRFGDMLAVGGESAGAHLSVLAMLDCRERLGAMPFRAANLIAGCYDLALSPSARNWGSLKLVLNTRDIDTFAGLFAPSFMDRRDPKISPLYADLSGLPPALFTVGTRDPLLDDTLFMAARWAAAGNHAERFIVPGGCHVFQYFDIPATAESHRCSAGFLNAVLGE